MTLQQEAAQKILLLPERSAQIILELVNEMIRQSVGESKSTDTGMNPDLSAFFGSVRTLGDGLETQRAMRDEWD